MLAARCELYGRPSAHDQAADPLVARAVLAAEDDAHTGLVEVGLLAVLQRRQRWGDDGLGVRHDLEYNGRAPHARQFRDCMGGQQPTCNINRSRFSSCPIWIQSPFDDVI
jgi:hypothetical protein